jgi:hypothetical protein
MAARHPADRRIVRAGADVGMMQQKIGQGLNASLNPARALRRMGGDVIEDRAEVASAGRV